MSAWLLSIAGIVIIGALVEILLTDSSIHKFVRSIYAFFVLFVIAQPLPAFFRDTVASIETGGVVELDVELMRTINSQAATAFGRNSMTALSTAGFDGVIVVVEASPDTTFRITAVHINAMGASFRNPNANINMKQEIITIVRAVTNVGEEVIFYVGSI